jgi:hypothetical protein
LYKSDLLRGDLLRGSIHMKFSVKGQEKGDLLIQVTVYWCYCYLEWDQDKSPPDKKPHNYEIIIQSYYICFILMVILKDILKN